MSQGKIGLLVLFFMGCATTPPASREEIKQWKMEQEALMDEMHVEQKAMREDAAHTPIEKPFFWRVSKAGKESYLLGTIHAGVAANDLPWRIHLKLNAARIIIMEADLGEAMMQFETNRPADASKTTVAGPVLPQLTPRARQRYIRDLRPIPYELLEPLTPIQAYGLYLNFRTAYFLNDRRSIDAEIQEEAKQQKRPLAYLETNKDMFGIVALKTPNDMTVKELDDFLHGHPEEKVKESVDAFYHLVLDYRRGDLANMSRGLEADYGWIIGARNNNWLPKLTEAFDSGNAFVLVGAAHMTGPDSLITMLKKKGYSVVREGEK